MNTGSRLKCGSLEETGSLAGQSTPLFSSFLPEKIFVSNGSESNHFLLLVKQQKLFPPSLYPSFHPTSLSSFQLSFFLCRESICTVYLVGEGRGNFAMASMALFRTQNVSIILPKVRWVTTVSVSLDLASGRQAIQIKNNASCFLTSVFDLCRCGPIHEDVSIFFFLPLILEQ